MTINVKRVALILGIIYVFIGIAGFMPVLIQPPKAGEPALSIVSLHGDLFGLFPVNVLHTVVHLAVGIWGVIAVRSHGASVLYARSLAVIFGVLTVMGLIPGLNTVYGLMPLYSHDLWLHALTAIVAAYFGFYLRERAEV